MLRLKAILLMIFWASMATSEPLAAMDGKWRGSGWARETPSGAQEPVRCHIDNSYDTASNTLTVSGQCAVPGQRFTLSGTLVGDAQSEAMVGRWSNPDGIGSTTILGIRRDGIVAFNFTATDPATGRDLAQNVEWRINSDTLHLRATDRANPDIMMSDISFTR
jgi:hypothetical protein